MMAKLFVRAESLSFTAERLHGDSGHPGLWGWQYSVPARLPSCIIASCVHWDTTCTMKHWDTAWLRKKENWRDLQLPKDETHEAMQMGCLFIMTPSNGNIFRVSAPSCGESTGHLWIPLTKGQLNADLWCFFVVTCVSPKKVLNKHSIDQ